ncbi:MAG: DUF2220 family protein [Promicromonosporaceae bacterium]|nr:DUF2220 family protein [Promicromonosporaceae bacterium]
MASLLTPEQALVALAAQFTKKWSETVCACVREECTPFAVSLRPGVRSGGALEHLFGASWAEEWQTWRAGWERFAAPGAEVRFGPLSVVGVEYQVPTQLMVQPHDVEPLLRRFSVHTDCPPFTDAVGLARAILEVGGILTPRTLRLASTLHQANRVALLGAVRWLREHPDLSGYSLRQLPIPGIHTKWIEDHGHILAEVAGRDVRAEVRRRPAVVHLTYLDPEYLARGESVPRDPHWRRHDSWTAGDTHDLAYRPDVVVVVENRDSRLFFPAYAGAVAVEGSGDAASSLLREIPWLTGAQVVYWGDLDAAGLEILDSLRADLGTRDIPVVSLLMDEAALAKYEHLGTMLDRHGHRITVHRRELPHLTATERAAYDSVVAVGQATVRRIEQEKIPEPEVIAALTAVLPGG